MEKNLINLFKDSKNHRKSFLKQLKYNSSKNFNFKLEVKENDI